MIGLYAVTIFIGAALLFLVQPLFARFVLPLLGGSPAVWNTAMVFYQAALMAGYAYAHVATTKLGVRRHALLHIIVLLVPMATLPLALPVGWSPPVDGHPALWMLALMSIAVGPAFFAVSATGPVIQKWFAASGHPRASDPYFLYAASNLGSMLALVAYPLLLEPHLRLAAQSGLWTWGYWLLVLLVTTCAVFAWRKGSGDSKVETLPPSPSLWRAGAGSATGSLEPLPWRRRGRWVLFSLVPSGLMLGVTNYISSDIAVVPLMWVVPLALYLLTFILAYMPWTVLPRKVLARALPLLIVPLVMAFNMETAEPVGALMALHLVAFFVAALLCHGALAADRPGADSLTEYYLWISLGGVLGGLFTGIVAPLVFNAVLEYPLMLVLVCLVALPTSLVNEAADKRQPYTQPHRSSSRQARSASSGRAGSGSPTGRVGDWIWPVVLGAISMGLITYSETADLDSSTATELVIFGIPALGCYFMSRRPLRFGLAVAALLASGAFNPGDTGRLMFQERSFFGVHRVTLDSDARYRQLVHGRTLHGRQSTDPALSREPLAYYHRSGPIGQVSELYARDPAKRIAVIGLGAGSMAAYAQAEQSWTFFEIDPVVRRLAEEGKYFTFLKESVGRVRIVPGDARLSLVHEPRGFDLIVLDAYSSDAIPVHLVTREALALYLDKLAPGGVLAFHISNLHLDLEPVFANLARDAGLVALTRDDTSETQEQRSAGKSPSVWLLMARNAADLAPLARDVRWQASRGDSSAVWTDDYSSLLSVMRWR